MITFIATTVVGYYFVSIDLIYDFTQENNDIKFYSSTCSNKECKTVYFNLF